ncbi:dTDP-glucose 4,6-dehydratase [Thermomonospora echinospora]|uniref:dTDP-glucose 4,6-dehydratase n=1 Tax=Thermomonospora echinospora TaxID=1992 RepID=A0A1H6DCG8_9ACTN|nr:dTDP-glucose 4,6-dehydratase [Thermomonospora echinospora]SEG82513.1 dTDP-glucose 4,6-dehydratase [Thermomonospora echinospora]
MRRVLVTGGAGFIGSHYVRTLLSGTDDLPQVTVLDKLTYAGNPANLDPVEGRFAFVKGDICDAELLAEVVPGHDLVVNFAAESHVDRSILGAAEFVHTNVLGTQTLMQACLDAGTPRVVHVSTDEVYGSIETGSWDERAPLSPSSPYAASKASGDMIALAYHRTHGLPVSITRSGNNYGPYQYPEKIIPLFATNLMDGLDVPLYGDGGNVRTWLHVDDHCKGIRIVAERGEPGEVYHIAGTTELTNRWLTERLLKLLGADWTRVRPVPDRKGHDRRYSLSDAKLRTLGYRPTVDFENGLAETIEWYAANRAWWTPLCLRPPHEATAPPPTETGLNGQQAVGRGR